MEREPASRRGEEPAHRAGRSPANYTRCKGLRQFAATRSAPWPHGLASSRSKQAHLVAHRGAVHSEFSATLTFLTQLPRESDPILPSNAEIAVFPRSEP